jgi:hypothetical protein
MFLIGLIATLFNKWLAPRTRGEVGATGDRLRYLERRWRWQGVFMMVVGVVVFLLALRS